MVVTHSYPPNYAASLTSYGTPKGPVVTYANWPPQATFINRINGVMNAVFAYGGATLFNELMAEMRRPYDFWKGFIIAEIFIYACYLVSGMVVYSAQGQFTFNPSYQGMPSSFAILKNVLTFHRHSQRWWLLLANRRKRFLLRYRFDRRSAVWQHRHQGLLLSCTPRHLPPSRTRQEGW